MSNDLRLYACYSYVALVLLGHSFFGQTNGQMYREVGGKKLAYYAVTVDPSGHGNFTTIQSAIDAVPSDNKHWISIRIKPGTYREKVLIPREKPYIILKGQNKRNTHIVWGDHDTLAQSYTFASFANNTIVKSISFVNSYSYPLNSNPRTPAVAALIAGDESTFYKCGFHGVQDTLWDASGRHYYKLCTIQGAVDFICGAGQSIFEKSTISVLGGALDPGSVGYITAQARNDPNDAGGFVFKDCRVIGNGLTYLGRPWELYSRVIFYNSFLSNVVVPQGWSPWDKEGNVGHITYAEQGCYGPGADTSQRVGWEKKLSPSTVRQLASLDFIDSDGWLNDQPL